MLAAGEYLVLVRVVELMREHHAKCYLTGIVVKKKEFWRSGNTATVDDLRCLVRLLPALSSVSPQTGGLSFVRSSVKVEMKRQGSGERLREQDARSRNF